MRTKHDIRMTSYTYIHNTIQQKTHNGPKSGKREEGEEADANRRS